MSLKHVQALAFILIVILIGVNVLFLSAESLVIKIEGKGDAFKKVDESTHTTTWGCNRQNQNYCSLTIHHPEAN